MGKQTNLSKPGLLSHPETLEQFMARMLTRPLISTMRDYYDEIQAKNQAYRFILEQGLLNRFRLFCAAGKPRPARKS